MCDLFGLTFRRLVADQGVWGWVLSGDKYHWSFRYPSKVNQYFSYTFLKLKKGAKNFDILLNLNQLEMEKTILFPTDFSDRADHALSEAIAIASAFSARLIIFHAYHRPVFKRDGKYDPETLLKQAEIQIEKQF